MSMAMNTAVKTPFIKTIIPLAMSMACGLPAVSSAQILLEEFDPTRFIVRIGGTYISPDDDSTPLKFDVLQSWDLYNTQWDIDSDTTWNTSLAWRPLNRFGLELVYIGSASYHADLRKFTGIPGTDNIGLGNFKAQSTNAYINWYFMDPTCLGQPYFGIGINYTDYYDDNLDREMQSYLQNTSGLATGPGKFGMGHSWGPTAQLGVDFRFGHNLGWLANASVMFIEADTDTMVTYPTELGFDRLYSDLDYNPWVLNLGVGYQF